MDIHLVNVGDVFKVIKEGAGPSIEKDKILIIKKIKNKGTKKQKIYFYGETGFFHNLNKNFFKKIKYLSNEGTNNDFKRFRKKIFTKS